MKFTVLGDTLAGEECFGIQRLTMELLKALDEKGSPLDIEIIVPEGSVIAHEFGTLPVVQFGKGKDFFWRQLQFPKYLRSSHSVGVDLTLGLIAARDCITGLYDTTYEMHPECFEGMKARLKRRSYCARVRKVARNAPMLFTISINSLREINNIYGPLKCPVEVLPLGWEHILSVESDEMILGKQKLAKGDYYFSLGSGLRHKNLEWVIAAARDNAHSTFVISGSNRMSDYISRLNCQGNFPENVRFTGYISDGAIRCLMENCKMFLHPSISEGFGLPPLEALALGAEVAIANTSCLPEIFGESVRYFDPKEYCSIDLEGLINERVSSLAKREVLERNSWSNTAKIFENILMKFEKEEIS